MRPNSRPALPAEEMELCLDQELEDAGFTFGNANKQSKKLWALFGTNSRAIPPFQLHHSRLPSPYSRAGDRGQPCFPKGTLVTSAFK